jgi:hypothetical protein
MTPVFTNITGFTMMTGQDSTLMAGIVEGPVAIAVDAQSWQM